MKPSPHSPKAFPGTASTFSSNSNLSQNSSEVKPVDLIHGNTYKAPKGSKHYSPNSLNPLTNILLLLLYSLDISLTLSSPCLSASIAAN